MTRTSSAIPMIRLGEPLPKPNSAMGPDSAYPGLVAAGQDLSASRLIEAARHDEEVSELVPPRRILASSSGSRGDERGARAV